MSPTIDPKIRKAFNRLVASSEAKQIREQLIRGAQLATSDSEGERQQAAELDRKWWGQLVTLAKRKGEFGLATWLRTTPHSFEIR
jgi:hypothetical protein